MSLVMWPDTIHDLYITFDTSSGMMRAYAGAQDPPHKRSPALCELHYSDGSANDVQFLAENIAALQLFGDLLTDLDEA